MQYGVEVSFAPKIAIDKSGSGLHIHFLAEKNGTNVLIKEGRLSDTAKRMIVGILDISDAVTGFGQHRSHFVPETCAESERTDLHLLGREKSRSVVVRVPLGWVDSVDMAADANFGLKRKSEKPPGRPWSSGLPTVGKHLRNDCLPDLRGDPRPWYERRPHQIR